MANLRILSNPSINYDPTDTETIFPQDWNGIGDKLDNGTDDINTSEIAIAGTTVIDASRTGIFAECRPDVTGTRKLGTASFIWSHCYATNFYGGGTNLTGVLLLSGGTMTGAIDMGGSKITTLGTPTSGSDAATKDYVDDPGDTEAAATVGSPRALGPSETRTVFDISGASAKVGFTLPTAADGLEFTFVCNDSDGLRVVANTGDVIHIGSTSSTTAGYAESTTVYSMLQLRAVGATDWIARHMTGVWSLA